MEFEVWHVWLILAIILFIIEIFVPTFIAACLGFSCVVAGIYSMVGLSLEAQLAIFSIVTLIAFFGARPFFLKYAHRKSGTVRTNVGALIGKQGLVIRTIENAKNEGRVSVEGEDWRGVSYNNEIIQEGMPIEVVEVNSTILKVKPLNT